MLCLVCSITYSIIYHVLTFILIVSPNSLYEAEETYVQQTISSLPSHWGMPYSNTTKDTTVAIKAKANGYVPTKMPHPL